MTDLKTIAKLYRLYLIAFAAFVLAALLGFWYFRGYAGNPHVGETISVIKSSAETAERRTDAIIDSAKHKEEQSRNEVAEKIASASSDDLPDLLSGLLRDYRNKR